MASVEQDELPAGTKEKLANLVRGVVHPAGIEELLGPKVRMAGLKWKDYLNSSGDIIAMLVKKGLIVQPDLKLTPEYRAHRKAQGGLLPTGEYAHLEQLHRDAWNRLIEARMNATPDRVVRLTPENNILPHYNGMKLLKEQPVVKAPRLAGINDASNAMLAAQAEAMRLKEARVGDVLVGVERQGIKYTGRMFRRSHLAAIFRAQLLDQLPPNIDDVVLGEVALYTPTNLWEDGAEAIIQNVPSISKPGKTHYIELSHIPIVDRNHGNYRTAIVTPQAVIMSYDLYSRSTSEKETLWPMKSGEDARKGDMEWFSHSTHFAAIRTMRKAQRQLAGGEPPGREFIVLPMFLHIPADAMKEFRKFYGTRTTSGGSTGGVIVEDLERSVRGGIERDELVRSTLPSRLVDLDIALHNLVAFAQYDLMPQKPKLSYAATAVA